MPAPRIATGNAGRLDKKPRLITTPAIAATAPAVSGSRTALQIAPPVNVVPARAQAITGIVSSVIIVEKPMAAPVGPNRTPTTAPRITTGAIRNEMRRLRSTRPEEMRNQASGLMNANARIVGVISRNSGIASAHFGPSTIRTISPANSAQDTVVGIVSERRIEYPRRN